MNTVSTAANATRVNILNPSASTCTDSTYGILDLAAMPIPAWEPPWQGSKVRRQSAVCCPGFQNWSRQPSVPIGARILPFED